MNCALEREQIVREFLEVSARFLFDYRTAEAGAAAADRGFRQHQTEREVS